MIQTVEKTQAGTGTSPSRFPSNASTPRAPSHTPPIPMGRRPEFLAMEHLAELELTRRHYAEAAMLATDMMRLANRLGPGSEGPFAGLGCGHFVVERKQSGVGALHLLLESSRFTFATRCRIA